MGNLSINVSDKLFVTLVYKGVTLTNLEMTGICSVGDVVKRLRSELGGKTGLMSMSLRNSTQGWRQQSAILIA